MPDMKLTPAEAKAIASYLLGKAEATTRQFRLTPIWWPSAKSISSNSMRRMSQTRRYSRRGIESVV